jgi:hypothetical protein
MRAGEILMLRNKREIGKDWWGLQRKYMKSGSPKSVVPVMWVKLCRSGVDMRKSGAGINRMT